MSKSDLLILGDSSLFLLHNLIKLHPNIMEILLIGSGNLLSKTYTLLLTFISFEYFSEHGIYRAAAFGFVRGFLLADVQRAECCSRGIDNLPPQVLPFLTQLLQ